jgi:hypothetical protein
MQRHSSLRAQALKAAFILTGLAAAQGAQAQNQDASGIRAVATYESVGLYWANPGANAATGCDVKFRRKGEAAWTAGLAMWFDARDQECRGSLVNLAPNTEYEAQFSLPGMPVTRATTFKTWANEFPVARTVTVPGGASTLDITEGGTAGGYVVYQAAPGATLDAGNAQSFNVTVNASYVIVRGFTMKGAKQDAIRISPDVKDVVIEDNDISGWGRTRDGKWGADMDSAIRAVCKTETLERVTIQRNKMHDPRYSANSWSDGHPAGPQGITISYCGGNHVIRHNEIYSTNGNRFNDTIGGEDNFTKTGFPNADTDIYGNKLSHSWDDGIEAEGGNKNVRIWGNYIDKTATGIATTTTSVGPVYIFRNIYNRSEFFERKSHDQDDRQPFFKSGSSSELGDGRRYVFHNTMLQAEEAGSQYGLGGGAGMGGTGNSQLVRNTVSMNNIYHLWKPNGAVYQVGDDNLFQNDMYNGKSGTAMIDGINATPQYAAGNGWKSEAGGQYALAAGTPGFDQGVRIANFNDKFNGAAPDVGAAEAGASAMKFGLEAAGAVPATYTPTPGAGGTGNTGTNNNSNNNNTNKPPATGMGTAAVSSTIDSSSYTARGGDSVTFTVRLMGSSGTPTGTVNFRSGTASIAGCSAVTVSSGTAKCTTQGLATGAQKISGVYSGSTTYGAAQAGPITQTIVGGSGSSGSAASITSRFAIDSSRYSASAGETVTFTVLVPNDKGSAPTGTVSFTANGAAIPGCTSVALSGNVAQCAARGLAAGSHSVRGVYSGNGSYSAGVAGPITQTIR